MFFGLNSVNLAILFLTAEKLGPLKENESVKSIGDCKHDRLRVRWAESSLRDFAHSPHP